MHRKSVKRRQEHREVSVEMMSAISKYCDGVDLTYGRRRSGRVANEKMACTVTKSD